jgi:protein O-GlcNAc transferase
MDINKAKEIASEHYRLGHLQQAAEIYLKVLEIQPSDIDVLNSLGVICYELGNCDTAISLFKTTIQFKPDFVAAYINLGIVLQDKRQFDKAITCHQKAIELNPNLPDAYSNLGDALVEQGRRDEALAAYDKAILLKPDFIEAHWSRCISHVAIIYPDHSSIQVARARYREELIKLRDTIFREFSQDIGIAARAVGSTQPFYLAYQGLNDRELQQLYGELVCQIMASRYPQFADRPTMPSLSSGEPLRIGIVSGYFHLHANWKIYIKGWIENLDKRRFSLYGYYTGRVKDKETEVARQSFSRFVEDIYSFEDLCKIIQKDNLHVLIYPEIGINPMIAQLAALRLAPIQCNSWGHPNTSGFSTIDYFLSGDLIEPPEAYDHYTEKLIRLPNLSIYYTPFDVPFVPVSRDTFNLRPKSILYHCCQALFKFFPQYDEIFPRIAQQLGDCQFLFSSWPETSSIIEQFRMRIYRTFNQFNLNANDHVIFLPYLDQAKFNALNRVSDIFLDPIGWSGFTTTLEAIDCNLPIVTFPSSLMRGRGSAATLTMMGLSETIATSLDEYIALAVKLGQDSEWRQSISEKISKNKHRIYRDRTCITALESFLDRVVKERL